MPIPQSQPSPHITPVVSFPTPRGRCDLAFYETRRGLTPANRRWTYGEKHPNSRDYPNHELVAVVPQDHEWERWYYAAPRADQHNYNWEYSEQGDWEILGQTFFVKRCEFSLLTSDYPAPDAELFDSTGYVVTALEEQDVRDETLQSLYVIVRVRREKILDNPKVSTVLDPQTNTLRTVTVEKVPVGTAAEVVGEDGQYAEVQALNTRWALKTTQFMAGLAGNGDGAFQQWEDVINYSWPDVLDFINFFTFPSSSGTVKSIGARPVWKRQRYDGPCRARITETWTKDPPIPPVIDPMLPQEIQYSSPLLSVNVSPCLHDILYIEHTPGTQHPSLGFYYYKETYEATTLTDWPEIHIASFTVRPAMGGYLSRMVEVFRPDGPLFTNVLRLDSPQQGSAANSVDLSWTLSNQVGTLSQYRLDVCTNPEFSGSFLTGFNNRNVGTNTSFTVTGLTPGINYFARVRAVMTTPSATVTSNSQLVAAQSVVSYIVVEDAQLLDGDTIDFGAVNLYGTDVSKTLIVTNTGNVTLSLPSVIKLGADTSYWTVTGPTPTSIAVGGTSSITLTFNPDTSRSYDASATLNFTNAPPATFLLEASAGSPDVEVQLNSATISSGATESFSYLSPDASLAVFNTGTGALTISSISITGTDADQWTLSPAFFDPITVVPSSSTGWTIDYTPSEAGAHTALLTLVYDEGTSPFTINLDGTATISNLEGENPPGTPQGAMASMGTIFYATAAESGTVLSSLFVLSASSGALVGITIPSLTISGGYASSFSLVGIDSAPLTSIYLAPGTSYTYRIDYTAGPPGSYETAQIDFTHDAPNESTPSSITLEGYVSTY
jgi:hypothetical protein